MGNNKKTYSIICAIVFWSILSCNSQNTENNNKISTKNKNSKEMEENKDNLHNNFRNYVPIKELDIERFNAKRVGNNCRFVDDDGMEVEQTVGTEFPSGKVEKYWENRKYPNSGYKFYSEYDANGKLVETSISFYGMVTGFVCFYNTSGNITEKEDWDTPYKFSIDNLIDKMKAEYNVDIVDTRICSGNSRGVYDKYNNIPLYSVYLYEVPVRSQLICYVIDGNTGKTLFTTTRYLGDDRGSIIDEYFNSLKK